MRLIVIVGARPHVVKIAPLLPELQRSGIQVDLAFIGSRSAERAAGAGPEVDFYGVELPEPTWLLEAGPGGVATATGRAMQAFGDVFESATCDAVMVVGDADTSLAAAISAAKAGIPVVHLEAGLRCGDLRTPVEINRVLISRVAAAHLTPTESALENLEDEGIEPERIHFVGSTMAQSVLVHLESVSGVSASAEYGLAEKCYVLGSLRRAENLACVESLRSIVGGLARSPLPVLIPDPDGLGAALEACGIPVPAAVRLIGEVEYRTMLALERDAAAIITDSSGVEVEACMVRVPCLTVRDCTELLPTLASGANHLVGVDPEEIRAALVNAVTRPTNWAEPKRWDRAVSDRVARVLKRGITPLS